MLQSQSAWQPWQRAGSLDGALIATQPLPPTPPTLTHPQQTHTHARAHPCVSCADDGGGMKLTAQARTALMSRLATNAGLAPPVLPPAFNPMAQPQMPAQPQVRSRRAAQGNAAQQGFGMDGPGGCCHCCCLVGACLFALLYKTRAPHQGCTLKSNGGRTPAAVFAAGAGLCAAGAGVPGPSLAHPHAVPAVEEHVQPCRVSVWGGGGGAAGDDCVGSLPGLGWE